MDIRTRCLPSGWYPESASAVDGQVSEFQEYIGGLSTGPDTIRGGIVPHAGWYFSGRLAAAVFHLASLSGQPDVVAVFGGHLGHGNGLVYADRAWETPVGDLLIDQNLTDALTAKAGLKTESGSTGDNTVEVQLPLVKYYFPNSRLVALRAPHSKAAMDIGRLTAELAAEQGKTIMAFGSTDLTHYGPNYGFSPKGQGQAALAWVKNENDKGFIDRAVAMDEPGLLDHAAANHSACSAGAVAAAISACRAMGSDKGELVDYYTSHDIMPGNSYVGYAGIVY